MFKKERKSLRFDWSHLGDIEWGRPNLGPQTTVAVYRLMQFTLRDALITHTDVATANRIFYDAGQSAGKAICEHLLHDTPVLSGKKIAISSKTSKSPLAPPFSKGGII